MGLPVERIMEEVEEEMAEQLEEDLDVEIRDHLFHVVSRFV